MDPLASRSGWLAAILVVAAALVPIGYHAFRRRRAAPDSRAMNGHAVIGVSAAIAAFLHTFVVLPALGSPASIRGGMVALGPAAAAFFLLFAHVGVGSRLRARVVRDRVRLRRRHVGLALAIVVAVVAHVAALTAR